METAKLVVNSLVAVGTIGATITAVALGIWGDWFRAKYYPSKLTLTEHTLEGGAVAKNISGIQSIYFHLKVTDQRILAAKNCRVMLVGLSRRDPSNVFQSVMMPFPLQFVWTLAPAIIRASDYSYQ